MGNSGEPHQSETDPVDCIWPHTRTGMRLGGVYGVALHPLNTEDKIGMVLVGPLRPATVVAIQEGLSDEIEEGTVVIHKVGRRTMAEFMMEDPAAYVGNASRLRENHSRALLELSKKINRVTAAGV